MVTINLDNDLKALEQSFREHGDKVKLENELAELEERLDNLEIEARKSRPKGMRYNEDENYWHLIKERQKIGAFKIKTGLHSSLDKGLYPTEFETSRRR